MRWFFWACCCSAAPMDEPPLLTAPPVTMLKKPVSLFLHLQHFMNRVVIECSKVCTISLFMQNLCWRTKGFAALASIESDKVEIRCIRFHPLSPTFWMRAKPFRSFCRNLKHLESAYSHSDIHLLHKIQSIHLSVYNFKYTHFRADKNVPKLRLEIHTVHVQYVAECKTCKFYETA